jgi:prevent-host-death family protein
VATVGAYEAKTHLPRLLARVARGERITITKHGVPVAMLVPPPGVQDSQSVEEAIEALKAFRRQRKGPPATVEEIKGMIEDGRL